MPTLALKLLLTPALIAAASLAGRRWGPAISGWLVGIPFTSGPITLFLALAHGDAFAADAATGTLTGTLSQAAFCLAYAWLAAGVGWGWPATLLAAALAFFVATTTLQPLTLPLAALLAAAITSLLLALRLMPATAADAARPATSAPPPRWDLPLRMLVATAFVLLLTDVAPRLGPHLTGLLAPFPLYAAVLAVFAHQQHGPPPAARRARPARIAAWPLRLRRVLSHAGRRARPAGHWPCLRRRDRARTRHSGRLTVRTSTSGTRSGLRRAGILRDVPPELPIAGCVPPNCGPSHTWIGTRASA